jgi:hypothetical protein
MKNGARAGIELTRYRLEIIGKSSIQVAADTRNVTHSKIIPVVRFHFSTGNCATQYNPCDRPATSHPALPDFFAFSPRPPPCRIFNPAIDVGFMPSRAVDADPDLGREGALGDLAVESGSRQARAGEHGFEADDALWRGHGWPAFG